MEVSRAQREEAVVAREEAETALRNTKKEIEAQELVRFLELWSSLIQISLSLSLSLNLINPLLSTCPSERGTAGKEAK